MEMKFGEVQNQTVFLSSRKDILVLWHFLVAECPVEIFYKVTNASIDLCILKCMKFDRMIMEQFKGKQNLYMIIIQGTDIFLVSNSAAQP